MKKAHIQLLLIVLVLAIVTLACVGGGGAGGNTNNGATASNGGYLQATQSANATATYGAEQFQIQLTARAQPNNPAP